MTHLDISLSILLAICGYIFQLKRYKIISPDIQNSTVDRYDLVFCFITTAIVSLYFWLNPFYEISNHYIDYDPAVFIYIGKRISEGLVPYVDIFDHKGLVLYFIQYLGVSLLPYRYIGVWLLELLNMVVSIYFSVKTVKLLIKDRDIQYLSVLIVYTIIGGIFYNGGNFTEEFAMSGIAYALYLFSKAHMRGELSFRDSIYLGISFSYVFFLRCNMVGVWAVLGLVYIISKICFKQYTSLKKFIYGGTLGVMIGVFPILMYCYQTNSLHAMIEAYFIFNLQYKDALLLDRTTIIKFMLLNMQIYTFCLIAFYICIKSHKLFLIHFLAFVSNLILCSMSGRPYCHYGMILIPTLVLVVAGGLQVIKVTMDYQDILNKKVVKNCVSLVLVVYSILYTYNYNKDIGVLGFMDETSNQRTFFEQIVDENRDLVYYLSYNTNYNDDVLILSNFCMYYLLTDRKTKNKYPFQYPPISISTSIYKDFVHEINVKKSDYIINTKYNTEQYEYFKKLMLGYMERENYIVEQKKSFDVYKRVK